jgi:tetratricopeptide (TPR) repeat protein
MSNGGKFIGREDNLLIIRNALNKLEDGKGSIICISGESGYGKTTLLKQIAHESVNNFAIISIYVQCQAPIGNFNVSNIQPLYPFARAMEFLLNRKSLSAEKQFAINVGMTALTAIPFIGDLFYAIKELGKDWRQFKREKSSETSRRVSSATADFYDAMLSYADKKPYVVLLDDMHWSDSQSIELLNLLAESIESTRILLVLSFIPSILETQGSPILSFLNQNKSNSNIMEISLEPFNMEELRQLCKIYIPDYVTNREFENWLMAKSFGNVGVIAEYLLYFKRNNPFDENGNLNQNFYNEEYLPATVHSAFSQSIEKLNDEERNILAICSAEGIEFTALVVAHLLNTDVVTAIKKLKSLQNKTGIIRSKGAQFRYGIKTTVYEFTQAFYHAFFLDSLEYEESQSLHGQIADFLKRKFNEANSDTIKEEIAPYLAAHSSESGDIETTREMLLITAKSAQKYGNTEIIQSAYDNYKKLTGESVNDSLNSEFSSLISKITHQAADTNESQVSEQQVGTQQIYFPDFVNARRNAVEHFNQGNYEDAINIINNFINENQNKLNIIEKVELISILIRIYSEMHEFEKAESEYQKCSKILEKIDEPIAESFLLNAYSLLKYEQGNYEEAYNILQKAARGAMKLSEELQLMTLSNIALVSSKINPRESEKYTNYVRKLARHLRFEEFEKEFFN